MLHNYGNKLHLGQISEINRQFVLTPEERATHLYCCGSTGTGKSKFLEHLIRQDIDAWNTSGCGLLLLDPHGSLYDSILFWMAYYDLKRPVIPIDLRDPDNVISYNLLRKRNTGDPAVIIASIVQAIAYVWGQSGTSETPLFARWADNILRTLYENEATLLEAEHLLDALENEVRSKLTKNLKTQSLIRDWALAESLQPKEFEDKISSTLNRLRRFLGTQKLRLMFGQNKSSLRNGISLPSLDLRKCLDEGYIVLVSLATERNTIGGEDASLFATLLLNDLWTSARERGKKPGIKPFYVYLDEFQNFVTPTMADSLDQARGFGLHMTFAHQFPNQLLHKGAHGQQVYDSIMENARSKVVFQVGTTNLEDLARTLFMGVFDPDQIKHELYSTKVMDYKKVLHRSESNSSGVNRGTGYNERLATNFDEDGLPGTTSESTGTSEYEVESESTSVGYSEALEPVLGKELSSVTFRSLDEQQYLAMASLFDQKQRHCVVRTVEMDAPVSLKAPFVKEALISEGRVKEYVQRRLELTGINLPAILARHHIQKRNSKLQLPEWPTLDAEPLTARKAID